MDLSTQLHLAAGLGSIGLGGAALLRDPGRRRNRLFAALCAALAVWTLGAAAYLLHFRDDFPWHRVYVLGSCAAAPLGLHFTLALASAGRRPPVWVLIAAYSAAIGLYISAWRTGPTLTDAWRAAAMVVLGSILAIALVVILKLVLSARAGPERLTSSLFLLGGIVAAVGGMSDFIPRDRVEFPRIGPMALMVFLLIICSSVLRHRFLDVDRFLARAAALITGAAATAWFLYLVAGYTDAKYFPLFVASLVVLAVAGPVGKAMLSGARSLLSPGDPTAGAFLAVSRSLQTAGSTQEIWDALEAGRKVLPDRIRVLVYILSGDNGAFLPRYRTGTDTDPPVFPQDAPLAQLLRTEKAPVTLRFLQEEILEQEGERRGVVSGALTTMLEIGGQMAVPLMRGDRLAGWILVGGMPERSVTADMAAAFLAVGNQAMAGLERLEAMEAAELRRAMAAVGEMAAGLAHEIRNPLAAIHGAAQALGPDADAEQSREMLEVIEEESERLGRVVGEFLQYARPGRPAREPLDLRELAARVARSASLGGFDLQIEIEAEPDAPRVHADPEQLRRAFENLVRNAWEAAGEGGVLRISIRTGRAGMVDIRFEDNGPGIPREEVSRIFQPFHSTKRGGTGLGLALVHRILEGHGGSVEVEGGPGTGAAFTLSLPVAEESI
jgi:signal transduction histidine kinase